jgi:hypothetical protein
MIVAVVKAAQRHLRKIWHQTCSCFHDGACVV